MPQAASPNADVRGLKGGPGRARSLVRLLRHWPWPMLVSYTDNLRASPPPDCVLLAALEDVRRTVTRIENPSPAAREWQVRYGMHRRCALSDCRTPFVPVKTYQRFCSLACRHVFHSRRYRARRSPNPAPRRGHCERCERPYVRVRTQQRFCSPACLHTALSRRKRGQPENEAEFRAWRASLSRQASTG